MSDPIYPPNGGEKGWKRRREVERARRLVRPTEGKKKGTSRGVFSRRPTIIPRAKEGKKPESKKRKRWGIPLVVHGGRNRKSASRPWPLERKFPFVQEEGEKKKREEKREENTGTTHPHRGKKGDGLFSYGEKRGASLPRCQRERRTLALKEVGKEALLPGRRACERGREKSFVSLGFVEKTSKCSHLGCLEGGKTLTRKRKGGEGAPPIGRRGKEKGQVALCFFGGEKKEWPVHKWKKKGKKAVGLYRGKKLAWGSGEECGAGQNRSASRKSEFMSPNRKVLGPEGKKEGRVEIPRTSGKKEKVSVFLSKKKGALIQGQGGGGPPERGKRRLKFHNRGTQSARRKLD